MRVSFASFFFPLPFPCSEREEREEKKKQIGRGREGFNGGGRRGVGVADGVDSLRAVGALCEV